MKITNLLLPTAVKIQKINNHLQKTELQIRSAKSVQLGTLVAQQKASSNNSKNNLHMKDKSMTILHTKANQKLIKTKTLCKYQSNVIHNLWCKANKIKVEILMKMIQMMIVMMSTIMIHLNSLELHSKGMDHKVGWLRISSLVLSWISMLNNMLSNSSNMLCLSSKDYRHQ